MLHRCTWPVTQSCIHSCLDSWHPMCHLKLHVCFDLRSPQPHACPQMCIIIHRWLWNTSMTSSVPTVFTIPELTGFQVAGSLRQDWQASDFWIGVARFWQGCTDALALRLRTTVDNFRLSSQWDTVKSVGAKWLDWEAQEYWWDTHAPALFMLVALVYVKEIEGHACSNPMKQSKTVVQSEWLDRDADGSTMVMEGHTLSSPVTANSASGCERNRRTCTL